MALQLPETDCCNLVTNHTKLISKRPARVLDLHTLGLINYVALIRLETIRVLTLQAELEV